MEVRKTWIEERRDVANGRLCGSVIATRKVKRVRPSIGALQTSPPIKDTPTGLKRKERKNASVSIFTCGSVNVPIVIPYAMNRTFDILTMWHTCVVN